MSLRERAKGQRGELAVRRLFERAGWTVRGLEGSGDHLALRGIAVLHLESKNHAVLRIPAWLRQATAEAPPDVPAVVVFKCEGRWYAALDAETFAARFGAA